jgi:hypothetical protein
VRRVGLGTLCLGLACGLVAAAAVAADDDTATVKHLRNIASGTTNMVATQMFAAGVRNCATRVDQVTNFLTKGTQSSALLFMPEREPDNTMVSVSAEVQAEGLPRAYASATFSPNTAIGCASVYETVQYWSESCNAVAARVFKGAPPSGPLGAEIGILTIGPSARVFLLRATSTSCVTIKKEVLK